MSAKIVMTIQKPAGGTPVVGAKVTLRDNLRAVIGVGRTDGTGKVEFNSPSAVVGAFAQIHGTGFTRPFDIPASGTLTGTWIFTVDPPTASTAVPVAPAGAGIVVS